MDRDLLEAWLEHGMSLAEIGALVDRDPTTVSYWLKKHGLKANGHDKHAPKGGLARDKLEHAVNEGLTLREIADRENVSVRTVRYWLEKYDITARRRWRRAEGRAAGAAGLKRISGWCRTHGTGEFVVFADGRTRCARCNVEAVTRRRREVKRILVEEAGGACSLCGYDRYAGALHFHHLDRHTKRFAVSHDGNTVSLARSRTEAQKCVLLCANCHAEVEGGLASLS
jgi:hypothetical protein